MTHKQFDIKIIDEHTPLVSDPFYAWLDANVDRCNPGGNHITAYLESLGFIIGQDKITEEQHKTLEYVEDTWFRLTPYHLPMTWDECFAPGAEFSVHAKPPGEDKPFCRRNITPELKKAVEESGFIYDVTPDTCYFEIINDRLYAKYQQILGSRFVCTIKEA